MYEPIIDPMIFYWIDILDKSTVLPLYIILAGILVTAFIVITGAVKDCTMEQLSKDLTNWSILIMVLFSITGLVSIFIPSKDTMYKMLIAKQVTPHNLQVTGETVDKALDKVAEKIIKVAKEIKVND